MIRNHLQDVIFIYFGFKVGDFDRNSVLRNFKIAQSQRHLHSVRKNTSESGTETGSSIDVDKWWKDSGLDKWTKKNLNFKNWAKSISRWFGGGSSGPPPNVSKYVGNLVQSDFAQGFGKMAVQTTIDGYKMTMPGIDNLYYLAGAKDYFNLSPTDNQKAGYYSAMALTFITPGGAEAGAERFAMKGN